MDVNNMPPFVWLIIAVYLLVISAVAVGITIYDKKIAIKNGKLEERSSGKKSPQKKSGGAKKGTKAAKGSTRKSTAIRRVPEKTLLIISALGGSIAMLITMRAIRHKTQHMKFMIGIPAIIVAQCVLVVALVIFL